MQMATMTQNMVANSTIPMMGLEPCNPLLKWPGGKRLELRWIRPLIPPHTRYVEPFFGGGSVFFDAISAPSFGNDIHPDLMMFYAAVQGRDGAFFDLLYSLVEEWEAGGGVDARADLYYKARDLYNTLAVSPQRSAYFFLLRSLAYGGMFRVNSNGLFNVPFGRAYAYSDDCLRNKVDYLQSHAVQRKIAHLSLSSLDFETFLDGMELRRDDFIFLDPPYDARFSKYHADFTGADQERLAQCLEGISARFMLVVKLTPLIEELYMGNGYAVQQYAFDYRFNIKGRFSRASTHVLITNYGSDI